MTKFGSHVPLGAVKTRAQALADVLRLGAAGDALLAHERAMAALERWPDDSTLRCQAVLHLARAGTVDEALALYERFGLGSVEREDERALRGRLLKDRGLALSGTARRATLCASAMLYGEAHRLGGGYFSAINAATLYFLAGDLAASGVWRKRASRACKRVSAASARERYWQDATMAEIALLAGDEPATVRALARAVAQPRDVSAWAASRRQLALICAVQGRDTSILDPLRLPAAVNYVGHMIAPEGTPGRYWGEREAEVTAAIAERLARHDAGFLCGSLACGADILFAEAALARGAELHAVLPFRRDDFLRLSVARGGPGWTPRFEKCLAGATSVTWTTDAGHDGDDALFAYASRFAMGQATLIARRLGAPLAQVALYDGRKPNGDAGAAVDVATWRRLGGETDVIAIQHASSLPMPAPRTRKRAKVSKIAVQGRRAIRTILYGDVQGFGALADDQVPVFERHVLGAIADALAPYSASLRFRNTWGDALFLAFDHLGDAARAALAIQHAVAALKLKRLGLPGTLRLRLAGHYGPTYDGRDPVRDTPTIIGSHVTRTARLEPVTPPGMVYVTEAFAAALALAPVANIEAVYVGRRPAAKDYGALRIYRLAAMAGPAQRAPSLPLTRARHTPRGATQ